MNLPGNAGESSCKRQENGDATTEPDRPLKKARFAWEVKGKYHLRNEISDEKSSTLNETDRAGSSSEHECEAKLVGNTEQNLEILGDYLLKQDFNSLDSITDTNTSLLPSSSIPTEKLSYPRYISTFESSSRDFSESSSSTGERMSIPKSMVYSNKDIEDQCIARWQARQMAKCFVDNTINRVLDNWMIAPLPADMDNNRVLALDAAEFINNLPGDNSIENEAILMAISAHGLQNNSSSSSSNENELSQNSSKDLFLSPPASPLLSDDDTNSEPKLNNDKQINLEETSTSGIDMSWNFTKDVKQNANSNLPLSFYPETSSSSYPYYNDSDNLNSSNNDFDGDENVNSNDNDIMTNHYDFLDAAVSFAIQYKGLTSYGTDYG
ncbi:probable myosin light chain kinase DDB_G0279831 [Vanessa atalanta]|uniref:probable myosin light chain kinase DDB_G0279831 n=1 Tax=Vanessa atalanta TaxID=42275 RepID=UPI001FCD8634|nr:probable myosin light chain kinase DDB_G0279831 [Vanessa atalanta]